MLTKTIYFFAMRLSSFLKDGKSWWKQIRTFPVSPEYEQWRHHFILKRIHLMIWVAIVVCSISQLVSWTVIFPSLGRSTPEDEFFRQNLGVIVGMGIVEYLGLLFAFVLLKVAFVRRYPVLIQLWLTFFLLLIPQIVNTIFWRQIGVYGYGWIMVFSAGPILMPVKWRSHFLCQALVLGHFGISYFIFGLRNSFVENDLDYFDAVYATVIVCSIVNLGVFLYERVLQQEFELRRQLRLFLYTVSHDLRNPVLGTIFLLKSLRAYSVKKVEVSQETLDQLIDSSDRQLQLIDSLLEAHTTETKGIALRPRPVHMETFIESVVRDMQPFLEREQATVVRQVSPKLPLVDIDPLQVRRVYENIIVNALEYNQPGLHLTLEADLGHYPSPHSQQKLSNQYQWVYCAISDDGKGIPLQQRSKLFDLYTRAASTKQSLNVGLGLYICRQIISAHGGEIGVESTSAGASFWFTLPIAK